MAKEIRNIYPGECLFVDDVRILRAQTFGASSTLNSDDVHELGNKDIVDSLDAVPTVAITLDTYEYATLNNECLLANKDPNTTRFVELADYESAKVDMYAPIIQGADYGKTNAHAAAGTLTIYRTMYIEDAYVTAINHTYNVTGIAAENYTLESDNKHWFWGDQASVIVNEFTIATGETDYNLLDDGGGGVDGVLASGATGGVLGTQQDDGSYTLGTDADKARIVEVYTSAGVFVQNLLWETNVTDATIPTADTNFVVFQESSVNPGGKKGGAKIRMTTAAATALNGNTLKVRYTAADKGAYFTPDPDQIAGLRHGQAQVYLATSINDSFGVKKVQLSTSELYWRLQSATANATLGREALSELGHFLPYARPLTFPIPVTVTVESIDADTELFAQLSGKNFDTDTQATLEDLLKDLNLIIKIYKYDDIQRQKIYGALKEAGSNVTGYNPTTTGFDEVAADLPAYGGAGADDVVVINSINYYTHDLAPIKVLVVKKLVPTSENQNLGVGGNATQTFDFKADNLTEGIGAASALCLGSDMVNEGNGTDAEEIAGESFNVQVGGSATSQTWQASKYGIVDAADESDF